MTTAAAPMVEELPITPFQRLLLASPETIDLALLGGRGGGKSHGIALLMLRGAEQYKAAFKALFVRRTYIGIRDFEQVLLNTFSIAYGQSFKYNQTDHVFQLPSRATVELGQIESEGDYRKYQGR